MNYGVIVAVMLMIKAEMCVTGWRITKLEEMPHALVFIY